MLVNSLPCSVRRVTAYETCTMKTASGATAVQVVCSSRRGSRDIGRIGLAHDDAEL